MLPPTFLPVLLLCLAVLVIMIAEPPAPKPMSMPMSGPSPMPLYDMDVSYAPAATQDVVASAATFNGLMPHLTNVMSDTLQNSNNWYVADQDLSMGGNWEKQMYVKEQVKFGTGGLTITGTYFGEGNTAMPLVPPRPWNQMFSGNNQYRAAYKSGKVQCKTGIASGAVRFTAKMPGGLGVWPAMWLLPDKYALGNNQGLSGVEVNKGNNQGWPGDGEIDVMEMRGQEKQTIVQTLHFGKTFEEWRYISGYNCARAGEGGDVTTTTPCSSNPDYTTGYHTFSAAWNENGIAFFIDDKLNRYIPWSDSRLQEKLTGGYTNPFTRGRAFHPIINLAFGGNFFTGSDADMKAIQSTGTFQVAFNVQKVELWKWGAPVAAPVAAPVPAPLPAGNLGLQYVPPKVTKPNAAVQNNTVWKRHEFLRMGSKPIQAPGSLGTFWTWEEKQTELPFYRILDPKKVYSGRFQPYPYFFKPGTDSLSTDPGAFQMIFDSRTGKVGKFFFNATPKPRLELEGISNANLLCPPGRAMRLNTSCGPIGSAK